MLSSKINSNVDDQFFHVRNMNRLFLQSSPIRPKLFFHPLVVSSEIRELKRSLLSVVVVGLKEHVEEDREEANGCEVQNSRG